MPEPTPIKPASTANTAAQPPTPPAPKARPDRASIIAEIEAEKAAKASASPEVQKEPPQVTEPAKVTPEASSGQDEVAKSRLSVEMRARRQAQTIRETEQAKLAEERRAWEAQKAQEASRYKPLEEAFTLLKDNPIEAFRKLGLDPRGVFSKALESSKELDPIEQLRHEHAALKAQIEAERSEAQRQREEYAKRSEENTKAHAAKVFVQHVETNAEKYAALDLAYSHIPQALSVLAEQVATEYHQKTGEYASFDDICQYLNDEHPSTAKARAKLAKSQEQGTAPSAARANALTVGEGSSAIETGQIDPKLMTPAQRRAWIIESVELERQSRAKKS